MVGQLSGPGWNQTWYHAPGTLDVAVEVPETAFSSALEHPAGGVGYGCFLGLAGGAVHRGGAGCFEIVKFGNANKNIP